MKRFVPGQILLLLTCLLLAGSRACAQGFGLSASTSASVVVQPNAIVYTINVTNQTGIGLTNVYVRNAFSSSGNRLASSSSQGTNYIISSSVVFALGAITNGGSAVMTLTFEPDSAGLLTNRVTAGAIDVTNTAAIDLVTTVVSPAAAQGFGFSATTSTNLVVLTNTLTYTFNLTNFTGVLLTNVYLTNILWTGGSLVTATNSQGSNGIVSSSLVFSVGTLTNGGWASMAFTFRPNSAGVLTNTVVVAATGVTNTFAVNVLTLVVASYADLGVSLIGPAQAVIVGDWMRYQVTVTNLGPGTAANVMLTNILPTGVLLKGVSPTSPGYTVSGSSLIFSLGAMASGDQKTFYFTVQPTNAGALPFAVSVGAADLADPNLTNNAAVTNLTIINYPAGTLVAVTNSSPAINWQNGLTEQFILLTNAGTNDVTAARVVVTGLTNQLFNAVGTNNGSPFVYFSAPLAAGQSVRLLLQFQPRGSFPFTNGQLHAFAVPLPDWTAPQVSATSSNLLARLVTMKNGIVLIEFPSVVGASYTVVYSDDILFTNPQIAPPSIVAPANRTQWLDYGPPTTTNAPASASTRFYRVYKNP